MDLGPGDVKALLGWMQRGLDAPADPSHPKYGEQYQSAGVLSDGERVSVHRGFAKGFAMIRETPDLYYVDTSKALPPPPLGSHVRNAYSILQQLAPPTNPFTVPRGEVTETNINDGLTKVTPHDKSLPEFFVRRDASPQSSSKQTAKDQLQTLKDIAATWRF